MGIHLNQSYEEIRNRILNTDPSYRVWEFGKPSNFGPDFQSGNFTISIIDQFGDNIPRLTSYETIMGYMPLPLVPTVILDSNVMSLLNDFVLRPDRLSIEKTKAVIKLLDYFVHTKVDYNPMFYSMEAFSKNKDANLVDPFIEFSKSILSLHMMDELHYLKRREIRPDNQLFERYAEKFGADDIDEMARRDYEVTKQMMTSYDEDLNVFYVILLKMALIHKTSSKNIISKMEMLYEFTSNNFGVLFGEEMGIAAYYFGGKLEKLIPLQKGAGFGSTISKLRNTAWDIYLLRFPAVLLSQINIPIPLAKICTGERELAYIGRKFFIWKMFSNRDSFFPALAIDYSDLDEIYPEPIMQKLSRLYEKFEQERKNRNVNEVTLASAEKIEKLKITLEEEIKSFCG